MGKAREMVLKFSCLADFLILILVCNFLFLAHLKRAHVRHVTCNDVPLMMCVISLYIGKGSHCNREFIVHFG